MSDMKIKGKQVNHEGFFLILVNDLDRWEKFYLANCLIAFCKFKFIVSKCLKNARALFKLESRYTGNTSSLLLIGRIKTAKYLLLIHSSFISISGLQLLCL